MLELTLLPVSLVLPQVGIFACPRVLPVPGFIAIVIGVHVVPQKIPEMVFPFPTWLSGSLRRLRPGREHCAENTVEGPTLRAFPQALLCGMLFSSC